LRLREYELALEQFEAALALDPEDLVSRQQKGVCLRRLSRRAEAEEWIRDIVRDHPKDPESLALLGRLAKEDWLARWERSGSNPNALTTRAARFQPLLHEAIERYRDAFQADLHHYYSAANAATLAELAEHLHVSRWTPDTRRQLRDAAVWSCLAALARNPHDHWARASLAELGLIAANDEKYLESYQHAVVAAAGDWFALDSIRQSLAMLSALGFLPDRVGPAMELVDEELSRASRPPRHVFLFTGHMIDKPDRLNPRFAPDKEPLVAEAIATKLDELGAGPEDIAVCSAACGGDILFAEKALDRGVRLQVHLPFPEADFLRASVSFAGENWTRRFYAVREQKLTSTRVLPRELGPGPEHSNAYSRNSVWQLFNALAMGADRVRFIYFWDGQEGDGPGGVRSTLRTVEHYLGRTYRLDPADIYGARNQ
jgi:hypothetical protein